MKGTKRTGNKTPVAQKRAVAKYDKKHSEQIPLKFNKRTDKDILRKLDSKQNVQGYIKSLIRRDSGNPKSGEKSSTPKNKATQSKSASVKK